MSSTTSSSLSRLLSHSKISSFDPKLPQIYTSPKAYSDRGDWGFTKPISASTSSKRSQYITLSALETESGNVPWRPNESGFRFLKRFKENPVRFNNDGNSRSKGKNGISYDGFYTPSSTSSSYSSSSLGPRPTSMFDKHSYRPLPIESLPTSEQSNDDSGDNTSLLQSLHNKRISSRSGHSYPFSDNGDIRSVKNTILDPFGENSDAYSHQANLFPNYNLMSEKQFEKFIERLRLDEHGLGQDRGTASPHSSKTAIGNYRKELERKEYHAKRDRLEKIKEIRRRQANERIMEAKETGSTPTPDALWLSTFSTSREIPDGEFLKRFSDPQLMELMDGLVNENQEKQDQEEPSISTSESASAPTAPSSSATSTPFTPGRISIDLWNESRKINTFNSADYLRKTLSLLISGDPSSDLLPTSSLVGSSNKTNSTGTRHPREGLQYSNPDVIYSSRLSEPIKGRVLSENLGNASGRDVYQRRNNYAYGGRNDTNSNVPVGINGMISELPKNQREGLQPIDYSNGEFEQSSGLFRFSEVKLQRENDGYLKSFQNGFSARTSSYSSPSSNDDISNKDTDSFLPSLIKSKVRSSRISDTTKSTDNKVIPGSLNWLVEKDGKNLRRMNFNSRYLGGSGAGVASGGNFTLNDDYSNARYGYSNDGSTSADGSVLNRDRRSRRNTTLASAAGTGTSGSNPTSTSSSSSTPTSFPYSRNENQIKIERDTVSMNRRLAREREKQGDENFRKAREDKEGLKDELNKLGI